VRGDEWSGEKVSLESMRGRTVWKGENMRGGGRRIWGIGGGGGGS